MAESLCGICDLQAARVLLRGPGAIVAVPAEAVRDGHVMVVSASHAPAFGELTSPQADAFMALVAETARAVEEASGGRCYVLRIGDNKRHLHFHVVPVAEGDPALAPFVFGESGWAPGAVADALPTSAVFEPILAASLRDAVDRMPASTARLPPLLVELALMLLAGTIATLVAWRLIGPPWAGAVGMLVALTTGRAVDDRMKGAPVQWTKALAYGVSMAAVFYFMFQWLRS